MQMKFTLALSPNDSLHGVMGLRILVALFVLLLPSRIMAAEMTFAERLGWQADDMVIIIHAEDAGMAHAANRGVLEVLEKGVATSFGIMMPCPWVPAFAKQLKDRPNLDTGVHLTFNSEWEGYRWGPLAGKSTVPGLVDSEGCFWRTVPLVTNSATADEVELEIRAQIERAEKLGMTITHLDSHMGALLARSDYFERLVKVGIEKKIPIAAAGGHLTHASQENPAAAETQKKFASQLWNAGLPVIDDTHNGSYEWEPSQKKQRFTTFLHRLKPGITQIAFHPALPTDEFRLITPAHQSRLSDTILLNDPEIRKLISDRGIILTTWKELKERRAKASPLN
ncbi:MAG: polysaccharide deacetylase family protein [Verrucomicrobiota bacterium]|nr:polysaccharide deacetylase family protein [Verrucomicrobiota bacterium]